MRSKSGVVRTVALIVMVVAAVVAVRAFGGLPAGRPPAPIPTPATTPVRHTTSPSGR
jgi:hypothetical protein